jgi:hypothetical protein
MAGNGTKSVTTGLCRDRASAGIVSSINVKNEICEVILVSQDVPEKRINDTVESSNIAGSDRRPLHSGRHELTVRALQTPIGGIVAAQEVPLILGSSLSVEQIAGCMAPIWPWRLMFSPFRIET